MWRHELQDANEVVLVVEGCDHQVPHAFRKGFFFNRRALRMRGEVFDNLQLTFLNRPFVDRTGKILDAILRRICPDSTIFDTRFVIEDENLLALDSGKAEAQIGLSKKGAEFELQAIEALV